MLPNTLQADSRSLDFASSRCAPGGVFTSVARWLRVTSVAGRALGVALAVGCASTSAAQNTEPAPRYAWLPTSQTTPHAPQSTTLGINQATPIATEVPPAARVQLAAPTVEVGMNMRLAPPLAPQVNPENVAPPPSVPAPAETTPRGLRLPPALPGALAPPLRLSPYDPNNPKERQRNIDQLFPNAPPLPADLVPPPGPNGRPFELLELENFALVANPAVRQAQAAIVAARGLAIQAGTHPNPVVGYEADTVGSGGTANYHGGYVQQVIKTAGKLSLAQAAASMDIRKAELNLRKTRIQVITQVQARYYAVLVAQEAVRASHALAAFTNEAYRVQVEQLRGGEAAPYEPMQLRVLANQAQIALVQSRNRYFAAWKQLAATTGMIDLPPTQLAGTLDMPAPPLRFDVAWSRVLERHTDIEVARFGETQARLNLRIEEITPIPDIVFYGTVQKDFTSYPFGTTYNMQAGLPLPIYDRNIGDITRTQGELQKAQLEATRVRNDLTAQGADAFERYENNRVLLELYRGQILPDQARVYRGVYERHQQQPDRVSFGDVIVAQQTLASSITAYLQVLGAEWQAVADLSFLCQVEDLSELQVLGATNEQAQQAQPIPQQAPQPPADNR